MNESIKKILDKLPASWDELTLRQFIKLGGAKIHNETDDTSLADTVGIQNTIEVISILTDTSIEKLESMRMTDLQILGRKIDFISVMPQPNKQSKIKFKMPAEITYNDFVLYETLSHDSYNNMPQIIQTFSKEQLTDNAVLNLPMSEVINGFFLQKKGVKKLIRRIALRLKVKLIIARMKEGISHILFRKKWQMEQSKLKGNTVGIG